jgi:hypothetical protein
MKILHTYTQANRLHAHYVSMLTTALGQRVEQRVAESPSETMNIYKEWKPDIVHFHGQVACRLSDSARIVITPHGEDISHCHYYAIIARSPMEQQRLSEHFDRIEVVPNPIITTTSNPATCAKNMLLIYQKVLDSNVLECFSKDTRHTLSTLLKAGITCDRRWVSNRTIGEQTNWRHLCIYANAEGVSDILSTGVNTMGLSLPDGLSYSLAPGYVPSDYKKPALLGTTSLSQLIMTTQKEALQGELPLCRICELHSFLLLNDIDEPRLMAELDSMNCSRFFARLLQIAHEITLLDEGFMPTPPLKDRQTQKLRTLITRHLQL